MVESIYNKLQLALEDWDMMQKTAGDEGADWAERFEMHFYEFIDQLKQWFTKLENKPTTIEDAENHPDIIKLTEQIPAPLQLNFLTELELIVDGETQVRFD